MNKEYDMPLDKGIEKEVNILAEHGIETFESCEGGEGHAFPEPTIRFFGHVGAGFKALQVALDYGLPVSQLRLVWHMQEGLPTGPNWEMTFVKK